MLENDVLIALFSVMAAILELGSKRPTGTQRDNQKEPEASFRRQHQSSSGYTASIVAMSGTALVAPTWMVASIRPGCECPDGGSTSRELTALPSRLIRNMLTLSPRLPTPLYGRVLIAVDQNFAR